LIDALKQSWLQLKESFQSDDVLAGVISRGAQGGGAPLFKLSAHFGGLSPLKTLALAWLFRAYCPCFQSDLINCALLYGY